MPKALMQLCRVKSWLYLLIDLKKIYSTKSTGLAKKFI